MTSGQWEYRIIADDILQDKHDDLHTVGELLKAFDEVGWELVSVIRDGLRREFYFKRPKSPYRHGQSSVSTETSRGGK